MDISVILPVLDEYDNLLILIPRLHDSLKREKLSYEIMVIDGGLVTAPRKPRLRSAPA